MELPHQMKDRPKGRLGRKRDKAVCIILQMEMEGSFDWRSRYLDEEYRLVRSTLWREIKERIRFLQPLFQRLTGDGALLIYNPLSAETVLGMALELQQTWETTWNSKFLTRFGNILPLKVLLGLGIVHFSEDDVSSNIIQSLNEIASGIQEGGVYATEAFLCLLDHSKFETKLREVAELRGKAVPTVVAQVFAPSGAAEDEIPGEDVNQLLAFAEKAYFAKDLRTAEKALKKAIQIMPNMSEARNNLGIVLMELKSFDQAEEMFKESILLNPNDPDAYCNLGLLYAKSERIKEAEKELRTAVRLRPDYSEAFNTLGLILHKSKRLDEAEYCYNEALRTDPDNASYHYNLGNLLNDLKRFNEAEKEYRDSLRIEPENARVHNSLGILLKREKRYEDAEKEYEKVALLDPHNPIAYSNLGSLLREMGRHNEAERAFHKAIELLPSLYEAAMGLSLLYADMGKERDSLTWRDRADKMKTTRIEKG